VVNSGGVKLFPEQVEDKLQPMIDERFIVASEPDDALGEKLILIIENPRDSEDNFKKRLALLTNLTKFEVPKSIYFTDAFFETVNGKIQREKTIQSVLG